MVVIFIMLLLLLIGDEVMKVEAAFFSVFQSVLGFPRISCPMSRFLASSPKILLSQYYIYVIRINKNVYISM